MSYIGNENERIRASRTTFTATGGETTASVTYTVGQLSVYMNGIKLLEGTDYVASTGTSITGLEPLAVGDVLDFVSLGDFEVADSVPASGGTFSGNIIVPAATSANHPATKAQLDANVPDFSAIAEDVIPATDDTHDLGSASKQWRNIYTGDLHLRNDRGDWTILEEEDYLCVVNNKNGKKYKMMLQEIDD